MSKQLKSIVLGDEYDEPLLTILRQVLRDLNADSMEYFSGFGGSQGLEIGKFRIGSDELIIEVETFIGVTISGSVALVEDISSRVAKLRR